jgi:site-specific DNA-cytosine methylase
LPVSSVVFQPKAKAPQPSTHALPTKGNSNKNAKKKVHNANKMEVLQAHVIQLSPRMREFTTRFPQLFTTTAWKASFTFLPSDIQLIEKKHMELLGLVDLMISGWECQGFSTTGFGEGLSDTRSGLFMDMIRLITWVQSISPTLGYVIENTPSQLDQKEKVHEHHTLVKH